MVENPSAELKRDVVKLNNVCNIYVRRRLTRVRRREEPGSMYLATQTRRDVSIPGYIGLAARQSARWRSLTAPRIICVHSFSLRVKTRNDPLPDREIAVRINVKIVA